MKILVVGTNRPCHRTLMDAGHEVVLAVEADKVIPADDQGYAKVVPLSSDAVQSGTVDDNDLAPHLGTGIEVVASYHDSYYEVAAALAAGLDARCVVDLAVTRVLRDKYATRLKVADLECGRVNSAVLEPGRPLDSLDGVGFPCVVKPLDSEASMAVTFVHEADRLAEAVERARDADRTGRCLVEEMVSGPEFSVETFSVAGRHHVLAVTEKFKLPESPVEQGHLIPARLDDNDRKRIENSVCEVLDHIGLTDGPGHSEFILSPSGPKLVESHNRMGGDRIGILVELATGIDYIELVARHGALIPVHPSDLEPSRKHRAAVWYSADEPEGDAATVTEVTGRDAADAVEHVVRTEILKPPGATVSRIKGSFDRPALAIASGPPEADVLEAARTAVSRLTFHYVQ